MSSRYNLRRPRAASPPVADGHGIGEFQLTANGNADSSTRSSPLTSAATPESPRLGAERRADLTYSEVAASRIPSPSRDVGSAYTNPVVNNIFVPAPQNTPTASTPAEYRQVSVEEVTDDDDDGGPWIQVQRRRRARSTGSMPTRREVPVRQHSRLTATQQAAVRRAEELLAPAERERFARRMQASAESVGLHADSESIDSRGEGPSDATRKGKTVDARNWGAVGIPPSELDPEVQQRELDQYDTNRPRVEHKLDGYSTDEQREMLAYWKARKEELHTSIEPSAPAEPETVRAMTTPAASNATEPPAQIDLTILWDKRFRELQQELDKVKEHAGNVAPGTVQAKKSRKKKKAREQADGMHPLGMPQIPLASKKQGKTRQTSLRPMAQLEPGSYLGRAFRDLVGGGDPGDFSSSSSSSGSSSSSSGRHRGSHGPQDSDASSDSSEKPEPYDGSADAQIFHKFMRQTGRRTTSG